MRNSKILKIVCYITIPILVLIFLISSAYQLEKNSFDPVFKEEIAEYFNSDIFLENYMGLLTVNARKLIYNNSKYTSIQDGDFKICYNTSSTNYFFNEEGCNLVNNYYLIIYKNLALTNVELTTNTNSIEKIKSYIANSEGNKTSIIDGTITSDSKLLETKGLQHFDKFNLSYYKTVESPESTELVVTESPYMEEVTVVDTTTEKAELHTEVEYHDVSIKDFEIYSNYKEDLTSANTSSFWKEFINVLKPYDTVTAVCIPVTSVLIVAIAIYLLIAIGHSKEKEEIELNDLDKLPLEIPAIISLIILIVGMAFLKEIVSYHQNQYSLLISGFISVYLVSYIICVTMFVSIIKRIKAKKFLDTSICGKILKFIIKIVKSCIKKLKRFIKKFTENINIDLKILIAFIIISVLMVLMVAYLSGAGIILDCFIIAFLLYQLILRANCFESLKNHLKNMYDGNSTDILKNSDYTPEFKDIVMYLNNISNGFEHAKQEGIKSERMKTELITNVSHDIKTPLTSIINYVDLLKKEEITNEKAKEYIDVLDSKSQRLKKLTEDLVEASKASSGNVNLTIEKINIIELIKQTTGEFEDKFKEKKLEIISTMPKETIYINADSRYMYRIIENLFSNISKYALDSSRVYIDVNKYGMKVKISVKNISKERLNISADELMQRFVRGDKSRTTEGSGLGISISKSLTELQNGIFTLQVDGDLFKVELEFDIVK